ncbi:hypothetical protein J2Z21_009671 [Streptomyces griseochromogenes]|uniref:OmpA-like domain-containing protein n=1 Tax=Streptomyces griseochromogenes TaxID=68214 RepID=A0A1B1AWX9_9ACTN|nr:hypothetical protein [Streptomyces griseochromogenes]ANP51088.1 hypothetical protein AVL59_16960 [Streptomyces griseochromogenes]MBP2056652.1 hypothetical protein [Streptomyces griseochromogenes]
MGSLALIDIMAPYALGGAAIGEPLHELLSALFVQDVETAFDDGGVVVSGMARFSAELTGNPPRFTPPSSVSFGGKAAVDHRTVRRAGAWWDFPDIGIRFRLVAPRASSPAVDTLTGGPGGTPAPQIDDAALAGVLAGLGQGVPGPGAPGQDAPGTVFHLDLLLDAATLHLPFLTGAMLGPDGMLAEDPVHPEVTLTLPRIKLSLEQTAGTATTDPQLDISLDSWAAHDIDDPAGDAYAELLRMSPPYALIGPGAVLGFGFQSLILDLSGTETPPELLDKFGVGADFRGVYLPDVRVFVRPPGLDGLGVDVSARELLIGIGPEGGVSGVFGLDIVKPDAPQHVSVGIYDEFGAFLHRQELPAGGAPYTAEPLFVPARTQWVVDVAGGQPPYNIQVDGTVQNAAPVLVTIPAGQSGKDVAVQVQDVHTGGQNRSATFPVRLTAASLTAGTPQGGDQAAGIDVTTPGSAGYVITMEDSPAGEKVTLVFTPPVPTAVTVDGAPLAVDGSGRVTVDLAHGTQLDVAATWAVDAVPPSTPTTLTAYFAYDQPARTPHEVQSPDDPVWAAFASDAAAMRTVPSDDEGGPDSPGWKEPGNYLATSTEFEAWQTAAQANPAQPVELKGMASKEHQPLDTYNLRLSQRRIWAMRAFLTAHGISNTIVEHPLGEQPPPVHTGFFAPGRSEYRRVDATVLTGGSPARTEHAAVRLSRPARPAKNTPVKPSVVPRQPAGTDTVRFKELHVRVEIDHNRLIAVEVKLKVDIETALESYLSKVKTGNPGEVPPEGQGPTLLPVGNRADAHDGVLDIRVQLTLDDTVDRWQVVAGLFEDDKDGFLQTPPPTAASEGADAERFWRSFFGMLIALAPLTDALAASNTPAGDVVALTVSAGIPFAALKLKAVSVPRITLYGGELTVVHDAAGTRGVLLLDVEVALVIVLDLSGTKIIDTDPKSPVTVRYKAVGFKTSGQPQLRDLLPVFDSSKGYTVNIPSTGGIKVPAPLGDILQVAGARIARSNPVNLELDLELKADLGVVSIDRTTIRIPLEGGNLPQIGALGVHISVPGAIDGHGYLAIYPDGFAGQLDVALPGLGVRLAAGLSVRHVADPRDARRTATAVLVTLEVDFPVPIPLGNSGLGVYGFGGLFAQHHRRDENPNTPVPALDWLTRVHGNPLDISGWVPDIDGWAIGLGAVLGTVDSGFTLNVKGLIIFELPGPRILMVMKADVLSPRPPRQGDVTATILAVIDLDLGRHRISIGLTLDYGIKPLLHVHIPVRAVFPFDDLEHFAIDAGSWYAPATVTFFEVFAAHGYVMIRGKGIPDTSAPTDNYDAGQGNFPLPRPLTGFAIMAGVSASFVWGDRGSGLYLSVGASIDVGVGFEPLTFTGELRLWGELHLWIIGVEASARLSVIAGHLAGQDVAHIEGEVHGKVDFFFFSIEGSVHVELGTKPDSTTAPPPLVTGVSLQSRAAALLTGVSSDRPIDGKLCDAHADGPAPAGEAVPIDSIIVVHLDCTPRIVKNAAFTTANPDGSVSVPLATPDGPAAPAVRRGEPYYTYRIKSIALDHALTRGDVPVVWWPTEPHPGSESKRELALLTRVPDPHPCAVERSRHRDDQLTQTWSTLCDPVAPATSVLWTFHDTPLGPSTVGWALTGTAWPDPPGSTRSMPPELRLDVAETWRTGDAAIDLITDIAPARVIGDTVGCDDRCWPQSPGLDVSRPRPGSELLHLAARHDPVANARLAAADRGACWAHALEAPFLRHTDPALLQGHPLGDVLGSLAQAAEQQRTDHLDDIIALRTGPVVSVRILLDVPALLVKTDSLVLRCFSGSGKILDEFPVNGTGHSRFVTSAGDVPGSWLDPDGPWYCRVREVGSLLTGINAGQRQQSLRLVLVDTPVKEGTSYIQLGIREAAELTGKGLSRPAYLVGIVETLTAAEVVREETDTLIRNSKITTVNGALKGMPDPPALLQPGTQYTLHVDWEWTTCDAAGAVADDAVWTAGTGQDFHFLTDTEPLRPSTVTKPDDGKTVTMPTRLDPWVLLTDPDEGEHFRFYGRPLRVVFSVDYLLNMYETYGVPLRARVRSASYRHSDPASPDFDKTFKDLTAADALPLKNVAVFTPWEDMVRTIATDQSCVDMSGGISRHQLLDLDLLLEPRTDYVFDIEQATPQPTTEALQRPLFRRGFTTSRYRDPVPMAADVATSEVAEAPAERSAVAGLEALVTAPGRLSAAALDAALLQAGLRPVMPVTDPAVDVLWVSMAGVLQPRVLIVRTPEPLVRTRREPVDYAPPGVPRLQRKVITLQDRPHLEVVPTEGIAGAPGLHIVSQPGLNTLVVIVDAGRGAPIGLTLREHGNAFLGEAAGYTDTSLLALTLDAATWEVV